MNRKKTLLIICTILLAVVCIQKKVYDINEYIIFKNNNYDHLIKIINKKNKVPEHFENEPKVTIITVVRNIISEDRKEMLIRNFESVHKQDYKNMEHLVIDGASNDGTVELLEEYRKKGWIRYVSEPDDGIYDAMNKGIDLATGKYINFLNSDDYFIDEYSILASISAIEKNKADFSFAANLVEKRFFKKSIATISEKGIINGSLFNHQTLFTTKESLVNLGKFDKKFIVLADLNFMLKLLVNGYKFVNISPRVIVSYNSDGFSSKNGGICREEMINFFMNTYKNTTNLTQKQIYELAICHRLDEDVLSKLLDFYETKNTLLIEKAKDTFDYRPLYGYSLFGIIPIITNHVNGVIGNFKIQTRLFNLIPIVNKHSDTKYEESNIVITFKTKLFGIIPVFSNEVIIITNYSSRVRSRHRIEARLFDKILLYKTHELHIVEENKMAITKETRLFGSYLFKETEIVCPNETTDDKCKKSVKYY